MNSELQTISEIHRAVAATRSDEAFDVHTPQMMADRNIHREREFLVDSQPINVVRDGPAFVYTLATGQKYVSFYRPGDIQWEKKN